MSAVFYEPFTPRTVTAIATADCLNMKIMKRQKLVDRVSARIGLTFASREQYDRTVNKEEFKTWLREISRYSLVFPAERLVTFYTTAQQADDILHGLSLLRIKVEDNRWANRTHFLEITDFKPFTRNRDF